MLTGYLGIAFIAGFCLFIAKFIIYAMFMSMFSPYLKQWVYRTPWAMILLDFLFAGLAAPITGMAGGTIAMLTMITFGLLSGLYIGWRLVITKLTDKYNKSNFRMHFA